MALAPQIDPGHVPSNDRQSLELSAAAFRALYLVFSCHLFTPALLSTPAQAGRLWILIQGRTSQSLANVQSPSWNHAEFCGIRTNGNRVLAAVALASTIALASTKVTDYSIRPTGGTAEV
jgi:hypothetical protein